jgi:hypothetical protein
MKTILFVFMFISFNATAKQNEEAKKEAKLKQAEIVRNILKDPLFNLLDKQQQIRVIMIIHNKLKLLEFESKFDMENKNRKQIKSQKFISY